MAARDVLDITVRLGSGTGRTLLSAFDNALQRAGVADFNLLTLSSVIPPGSRVRMVDDVLDGEHGDVLFCVRAEAYAAHPGDIAWAGLGWVVDPDGAGLFVEHHGGSEESVLEQIDLSLADMVASRPGAYGRPHYAVASAHCVDLPACAVAVAAYRVSSWFETTAAEPAPEEPATLPAPAQEPVPTPAPVPEPVPTPEPARVEERRPAAGPSRPIKVTLEQKIDVATARRYYGLYREAFGPLETQAVARQILHEGEFLEEMVDARVNKYVAWDDDGEVIGISTLTSDLSTVPWISPGFFAHRYPEHAARGAIYYMGWTLVSAERQGGRVFATMLRRMTEQIGDERAVVAWDMCMVNEEAGLAKAGNAMLESMADVTIETIDRQSYWAGVFHGTPQVEAAASVG